MSIVFRLFKKVFSRELEKKIKEWYLEDVKLKTYAHIHINGFMWYVAVVMMVLRGHKYVRVVFFVVFCLGFAHIRGALNYITTPFCCTG